MTLMVFSCGNSPLHDGRTQPSWASQTTSLIVPDERQPTNEREVVPSDGAGKLLTRQNYMLYVPPDIELILVSSVRER